MQERAPLAAQLEDVARRFPELDLLVMFGSTARGAGHGGSDVDLGLLSPLATSATRQELEVAFARAGRRRVDLVDLQEASPLLRFEIARDGVLVWEGRPHAWQDFKARAMVDWWDWKPMAERLQRAAARRLARQVEHGSP
ncbi:MAG: nucleotidyltransferase domain-containing protein [candidate division NC10 bacterium]